MGMYLNSRPITPLGLIFAFLVNSLGPLPACAATGGVYTQEAFVLPAPGRMVALSPAYSPAVLKGIKIDPQNPFRFHFFVDTGDDVSLRGQNSSVIARSEATKQSHQEQLKQVSTKLIKYFLASLTIPEKDLWVNLSPYEKDRIVPQEFGQTEMGRDLLAEDYLLKQITASLIYPESQLGKAFWQKVYAQARAKYGTTNIPINTFNKVWIVPEKSVVYENAGTAFVLENHLKVMLEEDYLSLQKHMNNIIPSPSEGRAREGGINDNSPPPYLPPQGGGINALGSQIVRQIVIPALTKEVNEGKNFAQLRQVFYSLILATWYKKKIKDSLLNKVYSNRNKIGGVNVSAGDKDKIYQEYLKAFKKGVYNYIKEEPDQITGQTIPRKYFSGGVNSQRIDLAMTIVGPEKTAFAISQLKDLAMVDVGGDFTPIRISADRAMNVAGQVITKTPSIENHGHGTLMVTSRNRLERVNDFSETMIKDGDVILESGLGYLPYGAVQLSDQIKITKPQARIIGMDIHLPHFIIKSSGTAVAVFDQNGELVESSGLYVWEELHDPSNTQGRKEYQSFMQLKANLMEKGGQDEVGNELVTDPLLTREFQRPNIEYRQADIFQTGLPDESVNMIRDFNLTAIYYRSDNERSGILREYARVLKNGGHVLLGRSATFTDAEEFLILKKEDNHRMIEDSFIFSIGGTLALGADDYENLSYFRTENGHQLVKDFWAIQKTLQEKYGEFYWNRAVWEGAEFLFQDFVDNLNKLGYHAEIVKLPGKTREFIKLSFVDSQLKNTAMATTPGIKNDQAMTIRFGNLPGDWNHRGIHERNLEGPGDQGAYVDFKSNGMLYVWTLTLLFRDRGIPADDLESFIDYFKNTNPENKVSKFLIIEGLLDQGGLDGAKRHAIGETATLWILNQVLENLRKRQPESISNNIFGIPVTYNKILISNFLGDDKVLAWIPRYRDLLAIYHIAKRLQAPNRKRPVIIDIRAEGGFLDYLLAKFFSVDVIALEPNLELANNENNVYADDIKQDPSAKGSVLYMVGNSTNTAKQLHLVDPEVLLNQWTPAGVDLPQMLNVQARSIITIGDNIKIEDTGTSHSWEAGASVTELERMIKARRQKSRQGEAIHNVVTVQLRPDISFSYADLMAGYFKDDRRSKEQFSLELWLNELERSFKGTAAVPNGLLKEDSAMITDNIDQKSGVKAMGSGIEEKGGIDLNPAQMSMEIKNGFPTKPPPLAPPKSAGQAGSSTFGDDKNLLNIDPSQVTGATFTIRTMTPVVDLVQLLGLDLDSKFMPHGAIKQ